MPLVVVITRVLPRQTSRVKSPGELPRSKPGIGSPWRSPRQQGRPRRQAGGHRLGLVDLATGNHRLAPGRQGVDHHGRGAEHVDHHRHTPLEAPRRDQARQQVDEHHGSIGRAHFRSCRPASSPCSAARRLWHTRPRSGEPIPCSPHRLATRSPPVHIVARSASTHARHGPTVHSATFVFPPRRFPCRLRLSRSASPPAGRPARPKDRSDRAGTPRPDSSRCMDARAERAILPLAGPRRLSSTWCISPTGSRRRRSAGRSTSARWPARGRAIPRGRPGPASS